MLNPRDEGDEDPAGLAVGEQGSSSEEAGTGTPGSGPVPMLVSQLLSLVKGRDMAQTAGREAQEKPPQAGWRGLTGDWRGRRRN